MMQKEKIGTGRMAATVIVAIAVLIVEQTLALLAGNLPVMIGIPAAAGNVIAGILYPILVYMGIKLWVSRFFKQDMRVYKMEKGKPKLVWCCAAAVMPCAVVVLLACFAAGQWETTPMGAEEVWGIVTGGVFYLGIGAGFAEEMVFRGLIMSALEYRWNRGIAIAIPSVLFAAMHLLGNPMDAASFVQLMVAGSVVGILFSLVTYESGSVWSSAVMHAVWNMVIVGGVLHIGHAADTGAMYNYVLQTDSFLLTGGDFGIEASVVSILVYGGFIALAAARLSRQKKRANL
ncbi:MAG: type II CAAX endopeptidase family protein [Eubacteriales bacterium]|nr:type II CAAX endopeptidase family protein [Eubacteriales bacterium]